MVITQSCPICTKPLVLTNSVPLANNQLDSFKCGHSFINSSTKEIQKNELQVNALDDSGHAAWDYQKTGVKFILDGGFNVILADQMRLGKTPQALIALRNRYSERKRVLIIVKGANMVQWIREYKKWCDPLPLGIYPITGSKHFIPPGFHTYIITHDLIAKPGTCKTCKHQMHEPGECGRCKESGCLHPLSTGDSMVTKLLGMGFDLVIVDEFHNFKNSDSARSIAFNNFLKQINTETVIHEIPFHCMFCKTEWTETVKITVDGEQLTKSVGKTSHCPNCFAQQSQSAKAHIKTERLCPCLTLSGTPIENIADEYFPALNAANPTMFPQRAAFRREFLQQNGPKWDRVKRYKLDDFRRITSKFILRREWDDVYSSRPKLTRSFTVIKLEDQPLKDLYNKQLDKIEMMRGAAGRPLSYFETIGELTILRQICGLAKTKWVSDYLESSMLDGAKKTAVGINHYGVRDQLKLYCSHLGVVTLDGTDNPQQKDFIMRSFERDTNNVLVINMIAGGEGMDFCYVPEVIVLEREWRSTREKQFEARFYNPSEALMESRGYPHKLTNVEYILCKDTIDEWFHDMLISKDKMFEQTVGNNWDLESDPESFKTLVERTLANRL